MDQIIRSTGEVAELRFVLVDVTETANHIGSLHKLESDSLQILAQSIAGGMMMTSMMKHPGVLQFDFCIKNPLLHVQTDVTPTGYVRSRVVADVGQKLSQKLQTMTVIKRNEKGTKVQESIVQMASSNLVDVLNQYQLESEQTRSIFRIECEWRNEQKREFKHFVGILVEAFPKASDALFQEAKHAFQKLPFFQSSEDIFNLKALLEKVASPHSFQIHKEMNIQHFCPCSKERLLNSLMALSSKELQELFKDQSCLQTECDFCCERYEVYPQELEVVSS